MEHEPRGHVRVGATPITVAHSAPREASGAVGDPLPVLEGVGSVRYVCDAVITRHHLEAKARYLNVFKMPNLQEQ